MIQSQQFRAVQRPKDLCSPYELVVVDGSGVPHLPLTVFYHETQRFLAERTAKTYLATLLPYFNYLVTDPWRREREDRWDSLPDAVRESVRDFLVEQLHYKAQPRDTDQLVRRTCKSPSTVHVFLCALKQFYHLARRKEWYPYPHPLTDPTAKLLQDVEAEERREAGHRPRMPQRSGVEAGTATLPVSFSYEEPRYKQRFHFLLWDRPSFVLAHADSYSKTLCSTARNKRLQYSPERNHFFLEFVGAESLIDPNAPREPDALFWFGELLRSSLIGERANCGTPEEIERKQAFLRSWGYGEREAEEFATQPFSTGQTGLLTETRIGGQANFLTAARRKTSGLLFTIETLYDAATFGLAALDFFTTTGARANELLSFVSVLIASMRCRWEELPVCWSDWSQREETRQPIT